MIADAIFAPIDTDLHLERIAGGNETEVYRTDDQRFVVKVKSETDEEERTVDEILAETRALRAVAEAFARAVGPEHSIPNYYFIARNSAGQVQAAALQPYFQEAKPLFDIDYTALSQAERKLLAGQLRQIIRRSLKFYQQTGQLPDLYGRTSRSKVERKYLNSPQMLPWRLWGFLVRRSLLRSHNLMLTAAPEQHVILVDYDPIRRGKLYQFIYYNTRRLLFWRDYALIWLMEKWGYVPKM
jgi:hypothetical protein